MIGKNIYCRFAPLFPLGKWSVDMANNSSISGLQVEISNRQILKIALPISLAIFVPQLNFTINNIFLGHYNQQSLAIASITGVYYLILE